MPDPRRYRCRACGNLTRFDVVSTVRKRSFHHYSVGGELAVEETEVLSEVVERVSCRWCERAEAVEELTPARADTTTGTAPETETETRT